MTVRAREKKEGQNLYLTLVDPSHRLPDHWLDKIELVTTVNSLGEKYQLEKETLAHYDALRKELLDEGLDIELDSGYRSVEKQQELWDRFSKKYGPGAERVSYRISYVNIL